MEDATMTADPIKTAARRARREQRLGSDAACTLCGLTTPDALIAVRRALLEVHHVCGRANDADLTVPVCRNCHAVLTEGQRASSVSLTYPPTILHQVAAALASFFTFLHHIAERGMAWSDALSRLITELDSAFPAWRELPSARALGISP
jgi:hypothetical protein